MIDYRKFLSFPAGVAYVLPGLAIGGAEKHVRDLVERLDRGKFSPRLVSTAGRGPMEEEFSRLGVPVHILEYHGVSLKPGKAMPLLRDTRAFFGVFSKILEANSVQIVHCYLPAANVLGTLAATLAGVPVKIVSKRALCRYKDGHPVYSFFEDLANLAADCVMANSAAVAEDVRRHERFCRDKMRVIHNGIDLDVPVSEPIRRLCPDVLFGENDPVVTYVANLFACKGHKDLVSAARTVVDAIPSTRFLVVGRDAGETETVRGMISCLDLEKHVVLVGERPDAQKIIGSSTLIVHPSHEEGFSNTILEAMAAGKAIVAARAGGVPEAVIDGETGLLVPPGDPAALSAALLRLLRDPSLAASMGEAGKERARRNFPVGKMVAEVERMYLDLLERNR